MHPSPDMMSVADISLVCCQLHNETGGCQELPAAGWWVEPPSLPHIPVVTRYTTRTLTLNQTPLSSSCLSEPAGRYPRQHQETTGDANRVGVVPGNKVTLLSSEPGAVCCWLGSLGCFDLMTAPNNCLGLPSQHSYAVSTLYGPACCHDSYRVTRNIQRAATGEAPASLAGQL